MKEISVNGTLIWYYHICKREVWLMSHQIIPDQENSNIEIGKFMHDSSYKRNLREISLGNIVIDVIKKDSGEIVVGEVKKSSKFKESARMQLLFYLKELRSKGIEARGLLMFPKEKSKEEVILNDETVKELDKVEREILRIVYLDKAPAVEKNKYCKSCAYAEFCYS